MDTTTDHFTPLALRVRGNNIAYEQSIQEQNLSNELPRSNQTSISAKLNGMDCSVNEAMRIFQHSVFQLEQKTLQWWIFYPFPSRRFQKWRLNTLDAARLF